jgi:hypothetical protein
MLAACAEGTTPKTANVARIPRFNRAIAKLLNAGSARGRAGHRIYVVRPMIFPQNAALGYVLGTSRNRRPARVHPSEPLSPPGCTHGQAEVTGRQRSVVFPKAAVFIVLLPRYQ